MPCDWHVAPVALPVDADCCVQQQPVVQRAVLWESGAHVVCAQLRIGQSLSAPPDHEDTHSTGTADYALGKRHWRPRTLHGK